jgi:hypothetical protein
MNLQENISRIKQMMGLISEQGPNFELPKDVPPWNPDYEIPSTYEFQTLSSDEIKKRDSEQKKKEEEERENKRKEEEEEEKKRNEEKIKKLISTIDKDKIVGSSWGACSKYKSKKGDPYVQDNLRVSFGNNFEIMWKGKYSGLPLATPGSEGDTVHQLFNVLLCELNPYLFNTGKKPNINNILAVETIQNKQKTVLINVQLEDGDGKIWQIDRRGGWGHTGGESVIKSKSEKLKKAGVDIEGPVTVISDTFGGSKITEYFITYVISKK